MNAIDDDGLIDATNIINTDSELKSPPVEVMYLGDLRKLEVKAGDLFVLQIDERLPYEKCQMMRSYLEEIFTGHKVLVLSGGMKLGVISGPVESRTDLTPRSAADAAVQKIAISS